MTKSTKPDTWAIWPENYEEIKASVRSLLSKDRATLKKRVEIKIRGYSLDHRSGEICYCKECCETTQYNQALDDVLALLGDEGEEV